MTVTIAARWHVTLMVREVVPSPARVGPPRWRSWFTPPGAEEIAARCALAATLTQEREQWGYDFALRAGGMGQ